MGEKNPTPISQNPIPVSPNPTPVSQTPTATSFSLDRDGIRNRILEIRSTHGCTNSEQFSQLVFGDKSHTKAIDKWTGKDSTTIPKIDSLALIAHSTGVSLDWLVFGKDNPPAGITRKAEDENYNEEDDDDYDELEPGNTVRGFIGSLMHLSTWKYVRNFKIEARGHDYFYNDVNISFSIEPFPLRHLKYGLTDTVAYLMQGIRSLADPNFLDLPCTAGGLDEKLDHYARILDSLPPNRDLHSSVNAYYFADLERVSDPFYLDSESFNTPSVRIPIPKSYDTKKY